MHHPSLPRILIVASLAALTGCVIGGLGGTAVKYPIADGQEAEIEFSGGRAVHAENGDLEVLKAVFEVDLKSHEGDYVFDLLSKNGKAPRYIKVDDVTDDPVATWMEDKNPQLVDKHWHAKSRPIDAGDKTLSWLQEIESSVRIYRFTVVTAEGETLPPMYEAAIYPGNVKAFFNSELAKRQAPVPAPTTDIPVGLDLKK